MPKLVVISEGFTGRSIEIKTEKVSIGRVEENTFHLPEPSISSHHCELFMKGQDVIVRDLNSTNGTFINGEKVTEAPLKTGQILRLGQVELRLETGTAPASSTKRVLDQTKVIPQGVKLGDLEQGGRPTHLESSVFRKKTNKTTLIFIVVGSILALVIIVLLVLLMLKMGKE